jgi:hypothetical protein
MSCFPGPQQCGGRTLIGKAMFSSSTTHWYLLHDRHCTRQEALTETSQQAPHCAAMLNSSDSHYRDRRLVHSGPGAAITNYHKLGGSTQQRFIFPYFWRPGV